jgi:osmotically-inducible protein OsmY
MARLLSVFAIVLACAGCSASSSATQDVSQEPPQASAIAHSDGERTEGRVAIAVPGNAADREIRRALNLTISHDADLRDRQISFIVTNGDINVTGIVRTEDERRKINDLALNIDGVKSVANAVLISE